jgi:hypothetical protein
VAQLTSGLTVLNAKVQNITGDVFYFYNNYVCGIQGVTITDVEGTQPPLGRHNPLDRNCELTPAPQCY